MKKQGTLAILVLIVSSTVVAGQEPSPTPGPRERREALRREDARREDQRGAERRRQAAASGKGVVVPRDNHTHVQVVSVDTKAGTMTFNDVEGETNTWQFEPAGIARDPILKPGARVTIIWKSDKTGMPIPTILGVMAVAPPAAGARSGGQRPMRDERNPMGGGQPPDPRRRPSPSPAASPKPSPPPG